MSRHAGSLNTRLRFFFDTGLLYSLEQLEELTGEDQVYIGVQISRLKNPRYCGKDEPIDLIQDRGEKDNIKRWGLRGAKTYAKTKKKTSK